MRLFVGGKHLGAMPKFLRALHELFALLEQEVIGAEKEQSRWAVFRQIQDRRDRLAHGFIVVNPLEQLRSKTKHGIEEEQRIGLAGNRLVLEFRRWHQGSA